LQIPTDQKVRSSKTATLFYGSVSAPSLLQSFQAREIIKKETERLLLLFQLFKIS